MKAASGNQKLKGMKNGLGHRLIPPCTTFCWHRANKNNEYVCFVSNNDFKYVLNERKLLLS